MADMQKTVHADTEAELVFLLTELGILSQGVPKAGMGWQYKGTWSIGNVTLRGVCALIWWNASPSDDAEAAEREELISLLRQRNALYEGLEPAIYLVGEEGLQRPSSHEFIGIIRDLHRQKCGVKVRDFWFYTDAASRDLYNQGASLLAAGRPQSNRPWKTMSGEWTVMTPTLLLDIIEAMSNKDGLHHIVAEQARAALAAGTLGSVYDIQWPEAYKAPEPVVEEVVEPVVEEVVEPPESPAPT